MNAKTIAVSLLIAAGLAGAVAAVILIAPHDRAQTPAIKLSLPEPETDAIDRAHTEKAQALINDGIRYLLSKRDKEGGWGEGIVRPAVTALVIKALVQHRDFDAEHPVVKDALKVLMAYRHDDGGFYDKGLQNYTTSIAVMALVAVGDPQHKAAIDDAVKFLKGIQIKVGSEMPDGDVITADHPMRGGLGYGEEGRPDLSNAAMTVEACHDAGVPADSEFMQEVIVFLERTQNRKESNPLAWAQAGYGRGGFVYAPAVKGNLTMGESKAGPAGPGGRGLRDYGTMTYAGFMSMLHAGLTKDDPRVRAAYDWIRRNWGLDRNANMPQAQSLEGLYYYYLVFAKALRAWGRPVIEDTKGAKHNWRHELIDALAERVRDDGSWVNDADRWHESDPMLVTAYAVLALQESFKD